MDGDENQNMDAHAVKECENVYEEDKSGTESNNMESKDQLPIVISQEDNEQTLKGTKTKSNSSLSIDSAYMEQTALIINNETEMNKECEQCLTLKTDLNKSRDSFDSAYTDSITSNDSRTALLKKQLDDDSGDYDEKENDKAPGGDGLTEHILKDHDELPMSAKSSFWDITDIGHEIEAKANRPRMNTLTQLTESAAYIDDMSCPSPGVRRLRSACRNAVMNLSQEMVFKSMSVLEIDKQGLKSPDPDIEVEVEEIGFINNHMRNLIVLSVGIALTNTAIGSLRNLQSSLNHDGGIGLYSLAASFLSFTIFSLLTPFIVLKFRPKRCLIFSLLTQLVYVIGNLQPTFLVFIPASFLQGLGNALLWNSMSTYVTYLARASALKNNEQTVHVASKFFGIFFFFYQFSVVLGNLISSLVLLFGQDTTSHSHNHSTSAMDVQILVNSSSIAYAHNISSSISSQSDHHFELCGAKYCHSYKLDHSSMDVDEDTKYLLLGLYGMCMVFAIVGCSYLLDPVKTYVASTSSCGQIINQISSVLMCILDKRFLLICGLLMYSTMQLAFVTAEVTKAFVTCPVGIFMVGYCMIVYGVCGGTTSFIGGRLTKYIGRIPLIVAAAISNLGLLAFMAFWRPGSDQIFAFLLLMGAWGLGDGIWLSQVNCIISAIFPEKLEEAFAASRTLQGLGGAIVMGYATQICMLSKMGILAGACIFGTSMYIVAEILTRRKQDTIDEEKSLTKA